MSAEPVVSTLNQTPVGQPAPLPVRAPDWLVGRGNPWPPDRSWNLGLPGHWWVRLLVALAVGVAAGAVTAGITLLAGGSADLTAALAQLVGIVVWYLAMCWVERRMPPYELSPRRLAGLPFGLLLGLVACSAVVGLLVLFGLREFTGTNSSFPVWLPLLLTGLVPGVAEELLFRGVLFRFTERALGTWWATAISGVFFGAAHLMNPQGTLQGAISIAIEAGVLLGLLYALTRNLWVVIGFHFAWNVVQGTVFGSVISGTGTDQRGWLISHPTGPNWLSGGGFGIEASPIAVVLLGLVAVVCGIILVRTRRVVPNPRSRRSAELTH